jgi:hypothetical protein
MTWLRWLLGRFTPVPDLTRGQSSMKKLLLVIALMLATTTAQSQSHGRTDHATKIFTADALLTLCSSNSKNDLSMCLGFIVGVLLGIQDTDDVLHITPDNPKPPYTLVCVLDKTFAEIANNVTDLIRWQLQHFPDNKNLSASYVVFTSLTTLYPCTAARDR